jgi:hypothetical protein
MRVVTAAVVGALCAAAWSMSFFPIGQSLCQSSSAVCAGLIFLVVAPVSAVVWALVAWALLRLARFTPAWPTALVGSVGTLVLLLALAVGLGALMLRLQISQNHGVMVVTIAAAGGYALAAAVTGGYGGRRDGAEHRGQDG